MAIFANDYIGIHINQFGRYEDEELSLLFTLIDQIDRNIYSGTALDIGANIGNHACAFAQHFSQVFAFEPNPIVYQLLAFNSQFHPRLTAINTALGDARGTARMKINDTNLGGSSISADGEIEVSVDTVDALTAAHGLERVTFIKIDVEGFEALVLEGAKETIRTHQPLICFEQLEDDFRNGNSQIIDFLASRGYGFCWIEIGRRSQASGWKRRLMTARDLIFGARKSIVSGDTPPARFHSMIIAVPQHLSASL